MNLLFYLGVGRQVSHAERGTLQVSHGNRQTTHKHGSGEVFRCLTGHTHAHTYSTLIVYHRRSHSLNTPYTADARHLSPGRLSHPGHLPPKSTIVSGT